MLIELEYIVCIYEDNSATMYREETLLATSTNKSLAYIFVIVCPN